MQQIAVIIYGPPGSGKSTQADLLSSALNLIRIDTGKAMEEVIYDPANRRDQFVQSQRVLFETGKLCEPAWAYRVVSEKIRKVIKAGFGVILSGSPRTLEEAFGQDGRNGIYRTLEEGYGKKNIHTFVLEIKPRHSLKRNTKRFVCLVCGRQYLPSVSAGIKKPACPICASVLKTRTLDKPMIIRERLREFASRTKPIFFELNRRKYPLRLIDGERLPYLVFRDLRRWLS